MGFDFFGYRVFDLSKPFGYFETFSTIIVVVAIAYIIFLLLKKKD